MTEPPRRDEVIELLKKLGSDRDEDVLEAAREVHARIAAAGIDWEALLVPEDADDEFDDEADEIDDEADEIDDEADEIDDEADEIDDDETPEPDDEAARPAGEKYADSIALIDELLAKSNISANLREELADYKTDIAEGEFESRDRRYIGAIHKRLSKRR